MQGPAEASGMLPMLPPPPSPPRPPDTPLLLLAVEPVLLPELDESPELEGRTRARSIMGEALGRGGFAHLKHLKPSFSQMIHV
mmetsp:Transcript_95271/g.308566  ORF Transcript_95271/g.308566 Transcript_95271/m.308566 type:complete len:83 (-) Transcript_95271:1770-2018(-)